jgi:hypothetical protein
MMVRNVAVYTLVWLAVYVPAETYVTFSIAGPAGLLHPAYIMDVVGMGLMLWGARAALKRQTVAPAILAVAWSWTAATMWRATVDRFWYVSLGRELYAGRVELWLAPVITVLAVLPMIASLAVVLKQARSE